MLTQPPSLLQQLSMQLAQIKLQLLQSPTKKQAGSALKTPTQKQQQNPPQHKQQPHQQKQQQQQHQQQPKQHQLQQQQQSKPQQQRGQQQQQLLQREQPGHKQPQLELRGEQNIQWDHPSHHTAGGAVHSNIAGGAAQSHTAGGPASHNTAGGAASHNTGGCTAMDLYDGRTGAQKGQLGRSWSHGAGGFGVTNPEFGATRVNREFRDTRGELRLGAESRAGREEFGVTRQDLLELKTELASLREELDLRKQMRRCV